MIRILQEIAIRTFPPPLSTKKTPIREFSGKGIVTEDGSEREHDIVVLATGYDNMTGSLTSMGLKGADGIDLKERWQDGVRTYSGNMIEKYPNLFMVYGPQGKSRTIFFYFFSPQRNVQRCGLILTQFPMTTKTAPTAFSNAPMFMESQANLIIEFLARLRSDGVSVVEPTAEAQQGWAKVIQDISDMTLFRQIKDSRGTLAAISLARSESSLTTWAAWTATLKLSPTLFKDYSKFRASRGSGKGAENGDAKAPPNYTKPRAEEAYESRSN